MAMSMCFQSMSFMAFGKCILLEIGELLYSKTPFFDRGLLTSRVQSAISSQSPLNSLFCPALILELQVPKSLSVS